MSSQSIASFAIDAVIPAHPKDLETLEYCIKGIKKNVKNIRRIIVVSKSKLTDNAEWFDEALYPFSYPEVAKLVNNINVGWNYQQLLKLYAPLTIPDISDNVLIVDADTVFYKKISFFDKNNRALYNLAKDQNLHASEFQINTLEHIKKIIYQVSDLIPELFDDSQKNNPQRSQIFSQKLNFLDNKQKSLALNLESGICHHMLMQKKVILSLFSTIENNFKNQKFYEIFLQNRQNSHGVAEYNLYFYFLISHFPNDYAIRLLDYKNTAKFQPIFENIRKKYHYCSYHSYMRKKNFFQNIYNFFLKKFKKIFYFEQWNIGISTNKISDIFSNNLKIEWLKSPCKSSFHADPFVFSYKNKTFIIFEQYSLFLKRGRIFLAELINKKIINQKLLLDNKKHLSYPCIYLENEQIYLCCESYKTKKLELFILEMNYQKLTKIRDIFTDKAVIDPTLFKHQNYYYLFYGLDNNPNEDLYLAYAKSLNDQFIDHPQNPIKSDLTNARCAGNLFIDNEKLYRPAQNCQKTYGHSLVINEIKILSPTNFSEEKIIEILPDNFFPYNQGIHTINHHKNLIIVDGKKVVFLLAKPLIAIIRKIKEFAC
ncbi:MAG: hypothetical protein ACKO47_05625 [Alphaproteobacteria bacterium]